MAQGTVTTGTIDYEGCILQEQKQLIDIADYFSRLAMFFKNGLFWLSLFVVVCLQKKFYRKQEGRCFFHVVKKHFMALKLFLFQ